MRNFSTCAQKGYLTMLVLVFTGIFIVVTSGLLAFSWSYHRLATRKYAYEQALHIAEAGIHYYRWHLAHAPDDFTSDTGIHDYRDPQGGVIGQFDIQVIPPIDGSTIVTLRSTGWTIGYPQTRRTVEALFGRPTLAQYGFLTNSNVWFGPDEELVGPTHSNGGIRMDGESDSRMTSAQETYICGPEHGCNYAEKPGIWGTGERADLWDFPVLSIDFQALSLDLSQIQDQARSGGILLGDSGQFGYHVTLHQGGAFSVSVVTALTEPVWGYDGTQWVYESDSIRTESPLAGYQNHPWPENNILFLEDDAWVDGEVTDRVVLVAGRLEQGDPPADIYIQHDLTMPVKDGSSVVGLIAQEDILVPLISDDKLEIDAILLAQTGHVFRYYYRYSNREPYKTYALRDMIETYGGILSNTMWTWSWVSCDTCPVISGYRNTETTYNPYVTYSPPPYWPTLSEYRFIRWEEKN